MKPLVHTGDSANIAWYAEGGRGGSQPGDIWAEVLRDFYGEQRGKTPVFRFRVHRHPQGEVVRYTYRPRGEVAAGRLPDDVVTRVVRKALTLERSRP